MRAHLRQYSKPIEDFCAGFKRQTPAAKVIGFVGDKGFLSQDGVDYICKSWSGSQPGALRERIDLSSGNWLEKLMPVSSPGLFALPKLFILTGLAKHKNKLEILKSLSLSPPAGFVVLADLGRASKTLTSRLEQLEALRCEVFEPRYAAFVDWLAWRAGSVKLRLTQAALRELAGWCSEDLFLAANELEKLSCIFAKQQGSLDWVQVAPFLTLEREEHIFALSDHLLEGRAGAALALCEQLEGKGESQLSLLGLCVRHLYQRLTFYQGAHFFDSDVKMAERLPGRVKELFRKRARQEPVEAVCGLISLCQQVEMDFKTGQKIALRDQLSKIVLRAAAPLR